METDFENILMKKLVVSGEYFSKVMPILKKDFFKDIGSQELFTLVKEYYTEYHDIPSLTELVAKVKNVPNAEIRKEIIASLQTINKTEEVKNIDFMCDETVQWVKDALYFQALQIGSDGLMKKDESLKLKSQAIMEERSKITIDSDLGLALDDIDEMIEYYSNRMLGIKTQHKELNKRLGAGFLPATLSVILSQSGGGKSLLMTDLVSGMIKDGKNVLLISLEMLDKEVMKRVHSNALDLPINALSDLSKTEGELNEIAKERDVINKERVIAAYNRMKTSGKCGKFFVKDYPAGSFSALMLEDIVESYRIEKDIEFDLVFVDYLSIAKSDLLSPAVGLYSYVKSIAEEFRASAKKLKLPIISAQQLNRSGTNDVDNTDNTNVSDSMGTVMTADLLVFLLQDEDMKTRNEIVCKCTKNRFTGITDTWIMGVDYTHMRFHDLLIQNSENINNIELTNTLGIDSNAPKVDDDFGVITLAKQKSAEEYANTEVKSIIQNDYKILKENKKNPFDENIDDIFAELGI